MFTLRSLTSLRGRPSRNMFAASGYMSAAVASNKTRGRTSNTLKCTPRVHQPISPSRAMKTSAVLSVRTSAVAKTAALCACPPSMEAVPLAKASKEDANDCSVVFGCGNPNCVYGKQIQTLKAETVPLWKTLAPGVGAAGGVVAVSTLIAGEIGQAIAASQGVGGSGAMSAVPVAIVTGMLLNNTLTLPSSLKPGLKFCTTTILRAGIVCIGIKLSMFDLVKLGGFGVPVVIGSIGAGLAAVPWLNNKLGLPSRLGVLIAAGSSICGVTAIAAVAPAIKANEREVALAVANVALFGTFGMLCYPYLAHNLLDSAPQIGMFLGTAIHDTSQVMGSAMSYVQSYGDEAVLKVAAVTKLTRNLFLAAVIPGLAWYYHGGRGEGGSKHMPSFKTLFPTFILGFVLMTLARTGVDGLLESTTVLPFDQAEWKQITKFLGDDVAKVAMGTAMAALGLSTSFSVFKGVGARAFLVGWSAALIVGGVGFALSYSMAPLINLEQPKVEEETK